jgi:GNAT superfamily N-acetyltransferase
MTAAPNRPAARHVARPAARPRVRVAPLSAERWDDLVALFGPKGAYGGCWCMFFRRPKPAWSAGCRENGRGNRQALLALAKAGPAPGLLAYVGKEVAGWCALAPRLDYVRLATSRTLQPADPATAADHAVWAVTCFYVARAHRGQGVTVALLDAAAKFARRHGAHALEGYPNDPKARWPDAFAYHGTVSAFRKAGFAEVRRVSPTRAIMSRALAGRRRPANATPTKNAKTPRPRARAKS